MHLPFSFSLFKSHLDLSKQYWKSLLLPGDIVVDATCGNGHDTLFLAQQVISSDKYGRVIGMDVQEAAIHQTQALIEQHLNPTQLDHIHLFQQSHVQFPDLIINETVKLFVYNLGYLPGSNKTIKTQAEDTLKSIENALALLVPGGVISVTCYPGHPEGKIEEQELIGYASKHLEPKGWSCCWHRWINRQDAPSLLLIQKAC